jgi:YHS domain-containing protein
MMRFPLALLAAAIVFYSCHQEPEAKASDKMRAYAKTDSSAPKFTRDMVDNLKDPSCGMPLMATVEDTLHYAGKVYGFCSKECLEEFKKNPAELARNAVMKK